MNQNKLTEILKKRDDLFFAESNLPRFNVLSRQREEIEKNIQEIDRQIEKELYAKHNPDIELIDQLNRNLKNLNQEMRKIDLILDEWEDMDEGTLSNVRENLFNSIWAEFPEQFNEKKVLWNELKVSLFFDGKIRRIQTFIEELMQILEGIRATRIKMKGKGILSYIFGTSPNAIIEKHLLYAHDLIMKNREFLQQTIRHDSKNPHFTIFKKIYEVTDCLKDECKKIWGFRHIDTTIAEYENSIRELSEKLRTFSIMINEEINDLKKQLDAWLNNIQDAP